MKYFKYIIFFPYYLFKLFIKGFKQLSLFLSRGFYFYFEILFIGIRKIISFSFFDSIIHYFQRRREDPTHIVLLIFCFLIGVFLFDNLHVDNTFYVNSIINSNIKIKEEKIASDVENTKKENNIFFSKELNYYRLYVKYSIDEIAFSKLRETNPLTKVWISVSNTLINYPVVQTSDNDYYLNHSFDNSYSTSGWIFMDYRNNLLEDKNTIFYGHNLLNKTGFGILEYLFNNKNKDNFIKIITEDSIYTYQVFSGYLIDDEVYYLQNNFYNDKDYQSFLDVISSRNILNIDNSVSLNDKIITLSTCTDDNKGRKVVHAKLIEK